MATLREVVVDPDNGAGTDYTSLNSAEVNEEGDITLATGSDEYVEFQCRASGGTADTTKVRFTGWTTAAANYIEVMSHADETIGPVWSDSVYRMVNTSSANSEYPLELRESFMRITNIQIYREISGGSAAAAAGIMILSVTAGANDMRVTRCIIKGLFGTDAAGDATGIFVNDTDCIPTIDNNLVYGFVNSTDTSYSGIYFSAAISAGSASYNTVIGCYRGIRTNTANATITNNIVQDCTLDYNGTFNAASSYNTDEDGSAPGSNSVTDTLTFNNKGANDYRPTASDITTNPGTPVSGITVDLISDARDGTTPTRGCFENVAGGGVTVTPAKAAFTWTGKDVTANADVTIVPAKAAYVWTGKAASANEISRAAKAVIDWQGRAVGANETQSVAKAVFSWTGKNISATDIELVAKMVLTWLGKSVTVTGDVVGRVAGIIGSRFKLFID